MVAQMRMLELQRWVDTLKVVRRLRLLGLVKWLLQLARLLLKLVK